jgi:hypothetical protein
VATASAGGGRTQLFRDAAVEKSVHGVMIRRMNWVVPMLALIGTLLQTYTSMKEAGRDNRAVVDDWFTEDELVDAVSRWRPVLRLRTRREVVAMRPTEVHRTIRHLNLVLLGWVMLDFAAGGALASALI